MTPAERYRRAAELAATCDLLRKQADRALVAGIDTLSPHDPALLPLMERVRLGYQALAAAVVTVELAERSVLAPLRRKSIDT